MSALERWMQVANITMHGMFETMGLLALATEPADVMRLRATLALYEQNHEEAMQHMLALGHVVMREVA